MSSCDIDNVWNVKKFKKIKKIMQMIGKFLLSSARSNATTDPMVRPLFLEYRIVHYAYVYMVPYLAYFL